MRGVMLEIPEALLEERRRTGADRRDELWDGVLHMVPPPSGPHQELGTELLALLLPICKARGLRLSYETGLFKHANDYRVPDLAVSLPAQRTERGIEGGAELVIELLSPGDESHDKLAWYAAFPVREVLLVDPGSRAVELFVLRGGSLHAALPDAEGKVRSQVLGVTFATVAGPRLQVSAPEGTSSI